MVIQPSALFSCWTLGWLTKTCRLLKACTTNGLLLFACLDYHHYIVIVLRNTFQVFIVIYFTQRKLSCKLLGFNQDVLFYHNPTIIRYQTLSDPWVEGNDNFPTSVTGLSARLQVQRSSHSDTLPPRGLPTVNCQPRISQGIMYL